MAVWIVALVGLALYFGLPVVPVVLTGALIMIGMSATATKDAAQVKVLRLGLGLVVIAGVHFIYPGIVSRIPLQTGGLASSDLTASLINVVASDGFLLAVAALAAFGSVLIGMFSEP